MKDKENQFVVQMTFEEMETLIESTMKKILDDLKLTNHKEYLSYKEAADLLDVKPETISKRVRDGLYERKVNGGKHYVKTAEIMSKFK